jgi:hypothetical protein
VKKRLTFQCWNCKRQYSLYKRITNQQTLIVACPYCDEEGVVKLEPYKQEMKTILKGGAEGEALGAEYQFPDTIPTQKPE